MTDAGESGVRAWAGATGGVVALLLALQVWTGVLLAFYYVPSAEAAYATVSYVEKVLAGGSWVRALHFHASQWLAAALPLHLLQLFLRRAYEDERPVAWFASLALVALVMANGATGYTLPWDARAFYSTRVAAGIASGLPVVGDAARAWLAGGEDLSTLTLSRFNALHLLVVPFLILSVVFARLHLRRPRSVFTPRLARGAVAAGLVFVALALVAWKWPAPLGPAAGEAGAGYLPRPGAQFLWLFQLLKYFPPAVASLVAVLLPGALLAALAALPFLRRRARPLGAAAFAACGLLVLTLTTIALVEDARDPRVSGRLAQQAREEEEFRRAPFVPRRVGPEPRATPATTETSDVRPAPPAPPAAYADNCARCHGATGEGKGVNPALVGVSKRPDRTVEDLVRIIRNPRAYQLEKRMPAFAGKLPDDDIRAIADWITTLN